VVLAGTPSASFATVPHNLHRIRRAALNPFFSKRSVYKIEPLIMDKVQRLCARFDDEIKRKRVIRLDAAYMALTMDIITEYGYGESYDYLSEDDYKLMWKETIVGGVANGVMLRQFPWALPILSAIPLPILHKLDPHGAALMEWGLVVKQKVEEMMERHRSGNKPEGTVFQTILDSDLPEAEKTAERLKDEGQSLVGAGSETTAKTLSLVTFYLLRDKRMLRKLRQELQTVSTDGSTNILSRLEKLPYLVGLPFYPKICPSANVYFERLR
jgi:cytochrome P450